MSKEVKETIIGFWLFMLIVPSTVLLVKLTRYLLDNPFKEWHIMLLWVFIIPISTITILIFKDKKESK